MLELDRIHRQIKWLMEQVTCLDNNQVDQNNIVIPISISYQSTTGQTVVTELNKIQTDVDETEIFIVTGIDSDDVEDTNQYMFRPGKGTYGVNGIVITADHLHLLSSGLGSAYLPLTGGTLTGKTFYTYDSIGETWNGDEIANLSYVHNYYSPLAESGIAGEDLSVGNIVYQDDNALTWFKTTATDIKKCTGKVGIVSISGITGGVIGVRATSALNTTGLTKGTLIYIGETPGTYSTVLPTTTGSYAVVIGKATDTNIIHFDFHTLTSIAIDGSKVNGVTMATGSGGGDAYLANTQTFLGENTFTDLLIIEAPNDYTPILHFQDTDGFVGLIGVVNPTTKDLEIQKDSGIRIRTEGTSFVASDGITGLGSITALGWFSDINTLSLQNAAPAGSSLVATNEWVLSKISGIDYSAYATLAGDNVFTGTLNTFQNNVSVYDILTVGDNTSSADGVINLEANTNVFSVSHNATEFVITADVDILLDRTSTEITNATDGTTLVHRDWITTYVTANADAFLKNIVEDTTPELGGVLRTLDNDIIITDGSDSVRGIIGRDATTDEPFFVRSIDGSYDINDGGILLAAGRIELHGANTEVFALAGTDNRQVYVNEQGGLFAVPAPVPGWIETDLDIGDYALTGIGTTWVEMTGLIITLPEDVLVDTTLNIITNLHIINNSATAGGNILVGFGVNSVAPTTGINIRVEGDFDNLVPVVLSTTQHGGLSATDTISVYLRRETQDSASFDPEAQGSIAPDHELQVSVPTVGSGSSGVYSFVAPLSETGGTVTLDETNFAKTNIAETFDSTLTITDFLTIGIDKDIKLTATTDTLNASLTAGKFTVNSTQGAIWTLPLVEMTHTDVIKSQIGVFGSGTTLSYSFLGNAYNDTSLKWFADGSVVINGTTDSTVEHAGFNFFVNGLAKFTSVVSGIDPVLDEHFITLGFANDKYSNEHALSVVYNSNYTTLLAENDYIVELIAPATGAILDASDKPIGFRQQILNNTGADIDITTTDPIVGNNIPVTNGLFAYYVVLADGVTWGLSVGSAGGGGTGTYTFTNPLVENAGVVTLDETNFAKTDVFETFNDGLLIKKVYADGLDILQLKTSTGVTVLDIQNVGGSDAVGIARLENADLQLNFNNNFELRQKNVGRNLIVTFKDESNGVVAGVNRVGTVFMQDPINALDGVNKQYLEANYSINVIDNLVTQSATDALSANQGFILDRDKAGLGTANTFTALNIFEQKVTVTGGEIDLGNITNSGKVNLYGGASGVLRSTIEWRQTEEDVYFSALQNGFTFGNDVRIEANTNLAFGTDTIIASELYHSINNTFWKFTNGSLILQDSIGVTRHTFDQVGNYTTENDIIALGSVKGTDGLISTKGMLIEGNIDTTIMIRGLVNGDYFASDGSLQFLRGSIPSNELGNIPNTISPLVDVAFDRNAAINGWDMVLPYIGLTVENYRDVYIIGGKASQGVTSQINSKLQIGFNQYVPDLTNTRTLAVNGTVGATSFHNDSLREIKENIKPFTMSGLDIINSLEVSTFDYKNGLVKDSIGVIIDDSPKEIANEEHNAVDLNKVIFVQAKAIQELSARLDELEKK